MFDMVDMVDMISYFLRVDTVYMLDMVDIISYQVATRLPQEIQGSRKAAARDSSKPQVAATLPQEIQEIISGSHTAAARDVR